MNDTRFETAFRTMVETYLREHDLKRYELAQRMHISPQLLSEILSGAKTVTLETKLKALHFMNTQNTDTDPEGLSAINASVLARFHASNHSRITHLSSTDGWTPREGGNAPVGEDTGSIADLLATIANTGNDSDVASKLRDLVRALKRVPSDTVEKAQVNRNGTTRDTIKITSNGARPVIIDTQSFTKNATGGNVLHLRAPA